ncbi:hypothetical protein ACFL51_00080 [Myxococcota bacterium]
MKKVRTNPILLRAARAFVKKIRANGVTVKPKKPKEPHQLRLFADGDLVVVQRATRTGELTCYLGECPEEPLPEPLAIAWAEVSSGQEQKAPTVEEAEERFQIHVAGTVADGLVGYGAVVSQNGTVVNALSGIVPEFFCRTENAMAGEGYATLLVLLTSCSDCCPRIDLHYRSEVVRRVGYREWKAKVSWTKALRRGMTHCPINVRWHHAEERDQKYRVALDLAHEACESADLGDGSPSRSLSDEDRLVERRVNNPVTICDR